LTAFASVVESGNKGGIMRNYSGLIGECVAYIDSTVECTDQEFHNFIATLPSFTVKTSTTTSGEHERYYVDGKQVAERRRPIVRNKSMTKWDMLPLFIRKLITKQPCFQPDTFRIKGEKDNSEICKPFEELRKYMEKEQSCMKKD